MVGILIATSRGQRDKAEKAFKKLEKDLTPVRASRLNPEKKAMAYYFACRLAEYGFKLSWKVMQKLSVEAKSGNAVSWFNLAKKTEGRPYKAVAVSGEASEYISWKFGKGEKPTTGEWSLVS